MLRASSGRSFRWWWALLAVACVSPLSSREDRGIPGAPVGVEVGAPSRVAGPSPGWAWRPGAPEVHLPQRATEPARVADPVSGTAVSFRLAGARPAVAELGADGASYDGALGRGTRLELRRRAGSLEDVVHYERAPEGERAEYVLDVRRVAGLRKVGEQIEFLDAQGAPRLRMEPPTIAGADGAVARAEVDLGCAHDTSPRAPWGRPVTPPGVDECRVTVRWQGRGVAYPAVLDPVWSATGAMATARAFFGGAFLPDGRLLAAGGRPCNINANCDAIRSTELYDPATGTWAAAADMNERHGRMTAMQVLGGVAVFGGEKLDNVGSSTVELYDPATGQWILLPSMGIERSDALVTRLMSGEILVAGGAPNTTDPTDSIEIFDPTTKTWSDAGKLNKARYLAPPVLLPDGKVMFPGGAECSTPCTLGDAEIYDPATKTSTVVAKMLVARAAHGAGLVQIDGSPAVLVVGGLSDSSEYYDLKTGVWKPAGKMSTNRTYFNTTRLGDGSLLVTGGGEVPSFKVLDTAERFDALTKTWKSAGKMTQSHAGSLAALSSGGDLYEVGGIQVSFFNPPVTGATDIYRTQPQGSPCSSDGECTTFHCADGLCCDKACDGVCEACVGAKTGGQDGSCAPIPDGDDPDNECATKLPSECDTIGSCNGKSDCARYDVGTPCGDASCADGLSTIFRCTAPLKCEQLIEQCKPYLCKDPTSCGTDCDSDLQCLTVAHCDLTAKTCVDDLPQGAACSRPSECTSGFCVDGVCCETACEGQCLACTGAKKEGGGQDGTCGPAKGGTDPHDDCADEPTTSCDKNGLCDGKGQCALYAAGTQCQPAACEGSAQTSFQVGTFACDGSGSCTPGKGTSCGLFSCQQGACKTSCADDKDCIDDAFCEAGACVAKRELGQACKSTRECQSGLCVDGVCCNSPCGGSCEACDVPKALGLCIPVSGSPHGSRAACPAAPAGAPCKQRTCDGIVRESCEGFVGPTTSCRQASCEGGVAQLAALCDGKGNCTDQEPLKCEPFVCSGNACGAKCQSDADCSTKFQCNTSNGDCVPRTGASCNGDFTLTNPDGSTTDCTPYKCEGAVCKKTCTSALDCVLPNICDDATRACVPAQPNPTFEASCAAAPGSASSGALLLLFALAAARPRRKAEGRRL